MAIYNSSLLILFCVCLVYQANEAQAQQCILAGNGDGLPEFENYRSQSGRDNKIIRHHQAIIPSYKFDCINEMCGNITGWGVDVHPAVQMVYTLDLQVWRPSPTVNSSTGTGCYSLVGNNRFTSISLDNGVAEPLIVPSSSDYIQFRPGDVLGFYVEEARDDSDGVVILTDNDFSFIRELVWYASIAPTMVTSRNGDCPYSVGSSSGVLNTLTRAAPVISISTVTFPCPLMATTLPTPPPNPTTDSGETPPTTSQQTQEPVDPSEGTGTELRVVPTTSETATDLPAILRPNEPTDIGLIIGSTTAGVVVIILTLTVVIVVAILFKKHGKTKKKEEGCSVKNVAAVPTITNQAYGLTHHSKSTVEENIYNFPEVNVDTIEAKRNEAYVTHTDIFTEGNQMYYGTNIATEINSAYGAVETADEYDYI